MGVTIRLKNVNIGSSPLGAIAPAFLPNSAMTLVPSSKGAVYKLPDGISIQTIGSPVITSDYIKGQGTTDYLKTNYVRDSKKDFTLAVVIKRDSTEGTQFFAGDYHSTAHPKYQNNAGMGIIATGTQSIRPTIHLTSGSVFSMSNAPPALLNNVNIGEWYFACLTVNATSKTATLYVPSLNVAWSDTWSAEMRPLEYDETFTFVGNEGGAGVGDSYLACASFYERHFTSSEVYQQYDLFKQYCQAKDIAVN